jgi:hypothetical protein
VREFSAAYNVIIPPTRDETANISYYFNISTTKISLNDVLSFADYVKRDLESKYSKRALMTKEGIKIKEYPNAIDFISLAEIKGKEIKFLMINDLIDADLTPSLIVSSFYENYPKELVVVDKFRD